MGQLFDKPNKPKKTEYDICEEFLAGKEYDIRIETICKWYPKKYQAFYKSPPLDYNLFSARRVFKNLASKFSWTEKELLIEVNKWFIQYATLGYATKDFKTLTLSSLKQDWLVEGLASNRRNTKGRSSNLSWVSTKQGSGKRSDQAF